MRTPSKDGGLFARIGLTRGLSSALARALDQWLPPALRDSERLMRPLFRIALGEHADLLLGFKERAASMTPAEMQAVYASVAPLSNARPTDLNEACTEAILAAALGPRVLEVGAGRGLLAARLADAGHDVTAVDFVAPAPSQTFRTLQADVEDRLPFPDAAFDTVVCAHTLEHLRRLDRALAELRRVAARRLILVVPSQRPYRYTFDLHLHFFPYVHSLLAVTGVEHVVTCRNLDGDLFYVEDGRT